MVAALSRYAELLAGSDMIAVFSLLKGSGGITKIGQMKNHEKFDICESTRRSTVAAQQCCLSLFPNSKH